MKVWLLLCTYGLTLIAVLGQHEANKGKYPYMAFIYYLDPEVMDPVFKNSRFMHNAILIKPDFLISSSIDPMTIEGKHIGFPEKTLLARIGAVSMDKELTYNIDDSEQEREIVQIIRPGNHNPEIWWRSDITLLKPINPFTISSEILPTLYGDYEINCKILAFVYKNITMERTLMAFDVQVQRSSPDLCGKKFYVPTMICAIERDPPLPTDFCNGNSGGPLVCTGNVIATQTYMERDCKAPILFQLLSKWQDFIQCGIQHLCNDEKCSCSIANKDDNTKSIDRKDDSELSKESASQSTENNETLSVIPAESTDIAQGEITLVRTTIADNFTTESSSGHESETDLPPKNSNLTPSKAEAVPRSNPRKYEDIANDIESSESSDNSTTSKSSSSSSSDESDDQSDLKYIKNSTTTPTDTHHILRSNTSETMDSTTSTHSNESTGKERGADTSGESEMQIESIEHKEPVDTTTTKLIIHAVNKHNVSTEETRRQPGDTKSKSLQPMTHSSSAQTTNFYVSGTLCALLLITPFF